MLGSSDAPYAPRRRVAATVSVLSSLAVVAPAPAQGRRQIAGSAGPVVPTSLSIMTFNIEYGGTVVDFDKILTAVRRADADVVAFNEAYGKVAKLGRLTDYDYVSRRLDLVSRYPIVDAPGSGGRYVFVQLAPGQRRRGRQRAPELERLRTATTARRVEPAQGAAGRAPAARARPAAVPAGDRGLCRAPASPRSSWAT